MIRRPLLLFSFAILAACARPPATPPPDRALLIEQRKDAAMAELAQCESGSGDGGASRYHGRFQFEPPTVIAYVKERDGRTISIDQAIAIARDYGQASALAKYIVFERDGAGHWPACSRRIGLAQRVAAIRAL